MCDNVLNQLHLSKGTFTELSDHHIIVNNLVSIIVAFLAQVIGFMNRVRPLPTLKSLHWIVVLDFAKSSSVAILADNVITLFTPVDYLGIIDDSLTHRTGAVKKATIRHLTTRSSIIGVGVCG